MVFLTVDLSSKNVNVSISEKIYPADYYESQIPLVEDYVRDHSDKGISSLQQEDVSELITGDTIYYQFTDKNGKKLYGTYSYY